MRGRVERVVKVYILSQFDFVINAQTHMHDLTSG